MGKLHAIGKVSVRVYANDHLPPHFHIVGVEDEALIAIATLAVLRGVVPDERAMDWARRNLDVVRAEWSRVNPRFPIS